MRQLPQTNFDQALSLVYEKMTNRPSRVLKEYSHENAEFRKGDTRGSMRSYIGDEIINAFEGDGEMDIYEFDDLARKYLGGGGEYDDMSQDDMVYRIGDEIGLDLEIRGDRVMLAGYKDFGEENAEQSVRDELNRAAERKSEERNRDIIARGGPGNALPTSRGLGQVDTSYKGANSERGTGSGPSKRPGKRTSASQRVRDELNRAAERKSRERNRDIIARGGPGDALPTDGRY